jgi:hypothetical protein
MFGRMAKPDPRKMQMQAAMAMQGGTSPLPPEEGFIQRASGAFGRAWNNPKGRFGIAPDQWRMIAAGARDLSRGTNTMDDLASQLNMERRQSAEDERQAAEDARKEQERGQIDEWINSLPEQYRALARVAPDAVVKMMGQQQQPQGYDWKDGGAFDPQTGQWTANPDYWREQRRLRSISPPPQQQAMPALPPGFQIERD